MGFALSEVDEGNILPKTSKLMISYSVMGICAGVFYYIGNNEYHNKGWLLALISLGLSFGITRFTSLSFFGAVGANVLFYIAIWIYNVLSNKPPRSQSGF